MLKKDIVIIGGGSAGLAAAITAKKSGVDNILIIEREKRLGGILRQCIHDGFGLHKFNKAWTGPEYAHHYIQKANNLDIQVITNSLAFDLTREKIITVVNKQKGLFKIKADAVILAMGSREKTAGAIRLPGKRPAGIYTAGLVQNFVNLQNIMVGEKAVILGSGDIGLIMARRLTLEGAKVEAVLEIMPYASGLTRNITQCLRDFNIPLKLSHTVTEVKGDNRVEAVVVSEVDRNLKPIPGSERLIKCDTLILSVGLIPENELSKKAGVQIDDKTGGAIVKNNFETNVPGVFSAGNVLHIHDVVDWVSNEAEKAGEAAAKHVKEGKKEKQEYTYIKAGKNINYVLPQLIDRTSKQEFSLRVEKPVSNKELILKSDEDILFKKSIDTVRPSVMFNFSIKDNIINKDIQSLEVVLR